MDKKITIGKAMTPKKIRWLILKEWLITLPAFYFLFLRFDWRLVLTVTVILYLIVTMTNPPLGREDWFEIDTSKVQFYQFNSIPECLSESIKVLFGKPTHPATSIPVKDICAIRLSYRGAYTNTTIYARRPVLFFLLKNGELVKIEPQCSIRNGEYTQALTLLEKQGVIIEDRMHLREALSKDSNHFMQYVVEWERQHPQ